jgi:antitoxin FitA
MADILVRGLDDDVVNRLKQRAALTGRSLQSETKLILERAAGRTLDESLAVAAKWRKQLGQHSSDSAREQREERQR